MRVECKEVKVLQNKAYCECGGEFEYGNEDGVSIALMTYPPQYPHICNKCGKIENFFVIYPFITYETII